MLHDCGSEDHKQTYHNQNVTSPKHHNQPYVQM